MAAGERGLWLSLGSLAAGATTLVCCALPALLVSVGAGAAVVGLVGAVPQLVWLSERKPAVFGVATALVAASAVVLWRGRNRPCPADPALAESCRRVRRWSVRASIGAFATLAVGAFVAFVLPAIAG